MSYYVVHIRLTYAHILFLCVSKSLKSLNKKRIYKNGFKAHGELAPGEQVFSVDVTFSRVLLKSPTTDPPTTDPPTFYHLPTNPPTTTTYPPTDYNQNSLNRRPDLRHVLHFLILENSQSFNSYCYSINCYWVKNNSMCFHISD